MIFRYTSTTEMISYNTGNSYPILNRRKTSLGDRTAGDLVDWSTTGPQTSGSNRQYAIRAIVKQGKLIMKYMQFQSVFYDFFKLKRHISQYCVLTLVIFFSHDCLPRNCALNCFYLTNGHNNLPYNIRVLQDKLQRPHMIC